MKNNKAERVNKYHHPVLSTYYDVNSGWQQWYLLMSDNHHDSLMCDRSVEKRHLDIARERNARVLMFGDFFDAMLGRYDPRRNLDEVRPEYKFENYYDLIVEDAAAFLKPYADLIDIVADGNHELAVRKYANISLLDRLCMLLNSGGHANITHGGFGGWVKFLFDADGSKSSLNLKYFHGTGTEAPVTRGVIQTNRQAVYLPDADIVANGHNHHAYYVPITRERISQQGRQYFDVQHHIRIPGYRQSYGDGSAGWDVCRGGVPKPVGCFWMLLSCTYAGAKNRSNNGAVISPQLIPDIVTPVPMSIPMYATQSYSETGIMYPYHEEDSSEGDG